MCSACGDALERLHDRLGLDEQEAVGVLWEHTAFPCGDGATVARQVDEFIAAAEGAEAGG